MDQAVKLFYRPCLSKTPNNADALCYLRLLLHKANKLSYIGAEG
jgi:hypothetical protein